MTVSLDAAMALAQLLGDEALGLSSPNPPVGAVVVSPGGQYIGTGHTHPAGGPHAEIMALRAAGERARGATLVCTLEPCAHTGRTGPCTAAIIEAGIAEVAYAVTDPNPLAAGGAQVLRDAGITVHAGLQSEDAEAGALRYWLHTQRTGRPFVTWKVAQSLDGQVAAEDGSSQWITSPQARADVHILRRQVDAVIAGAGTLRRDNPRLTARDEDGRDLKRQPLRVIISSAGRIDPAATAFDNAAPTLLAVGPSASHEHIETLRGRGIEVWVSPGSAAQGIDLQALGRELAQRGVLHALLEGGPTTAGSFIAAGLADEARIYLAPKLLLSGMWPALRGYGVNSIEDAIELDIIELERFGPDIRVTAEPRVRGES
ncbi:bifunctional diaminohydroxyphosphoribosylaminopyrimidine deaminase/5-amino-6-(5-phosphoribosylamino)uracil reductase RibD [Epidermidibacterium keratini]|uniref:Riboflavin biosynthesis protein RibD n=1 Tax=Epidermidibacterium keratini TaxID=1891644 RepID=A0A7L4YKE5_9ACTN|nr:bifunctional diaminohydroxyphosphoribosylaminopyrimidine deaminase/5-amino-6-(5-phosphoribosylamino)uracil reductase RibD [Epidermidibacterium keratini]QHB99006.1 bifunctional diaminohydroxyphosphoribosylaminopyrimidine deaminase/5-amino-6-(5-phosphoribosylamino)uracil reductase RibD [Epidermidibacterium keratini]